MSTEPLTPEEEAAARAAVARGSEWYQTNSIEARAFATLDAARAAQDVAGRETCPACGRELWSDPRLVEDVK
jgi:hypothetical protein